MARSLIHLITLTFTFTFTILIQSSPSTSLEASADPTAPLLLRPPHGGARTSMLLPLFLSHPNSSSTSSNPHRHLQRSDPPTQPNARMGLHDDLLRNGYSSHSLLIIIDRECGNCGRECGHI